MDSCPSPEVDGNSLLEKDSRSTTDEDADSESLIETSLLVTVLSGDEGSDCDTYGYKGDRTCGELFMCDACDFRTTAMANLRTHLTSHNKKRLYSCEQCDYTAGQSSQLRLHRMRHSGERPFVCDECNYRSTNARDLAKHKRTHTGDRPFRCDVCDYAACQSGQLKRHTMRHTGESPFACDECGYATTNMSDLRKHARTHTGDRPFGCDRCDYRAVTSSHLARHLRTQHTGGRPPAVGKKRGPRLDLYNKSLAGRSFECDHCEYTTTDVSNFRRHKRRKHAV